MWRFKHAFKVRSSTHVLYSIIELRQKYRTDIKTSVLPKKFSVLYAQLVT